MTSSVWANALLVAVVLAPLAAVVLATAVAAPNADQRWITSACAFAAAGSGLLVVTGQHPHVSRLAPDDLALVAVVAIALLALSLPAPSRTAVLASVVTVASCAVASGAPGQPSTVGPVLGIAGVAALLGLTGEGRRATSMLMGAGVVVLAAGVHAGGHGGGAAVIVGAAVVALAGSAVARRAPCVMVPLVFVLGLRVGPVLSGTSTARWVAVVLGLVGAAIAVWPVVRPSFTTPAIGVALVPWMLAAAVGPFAGTPGAARALAAGTVLALALGGPLALLAAVPGAAAMAYAIADGGGWVRAALAVAAIATLVGVIDVRTDVRTAVRADARPGPLRAVDGLLLLAGAWLVVRPTSWTWIRADGLRAYSDGTALALATALISGVAMTIAGGRFATEPLVPWLVAGDDGKEGLDGDRPARFDTAAVTAVALMGLVAAALVRSARL